MTPTFLPFRRRTLAFFLPVILAASARAEDDAPRVMKLPGDSYMLNGPAFRKLDDELKRLQAVEREHKGESWLGVFLVGAGTGALIATATALTIWFLSSSSQTATGPTPPSAPGG